MLANGIFLVYIISMRLDLACHTMAVLDKVGVTERLQQKRKNRWMTPLNFAELWTLRLLLHSTLFHIIHNQGNRGNLSGGVVDSYSCNSTFTPNPPKVINFLVTRATEVTKTMSNKVWATKVVWTHPFKNVMRYSTDTIKSKYQLDIRRCFLFL